MKFFLRCIYASALFLCIQMLPSDGFVAGVHAAEIEEVLVTARRREESLQETPLSILAFSAAALDKQNATNIADLNHKLPNVFAGAGGGFGTGNANFSIRGIGADRNAINQESATALYIDDAYLSRSDGALLHVLDVERIEVLRGPQGTLFGRNATAGAIRYITKKPTDENEASVRLTAGTDSRLDGRLIANWAFAENAALRFTVASLNQDGFQKNAIGQDLGDTDTDLVRAHLRWNPGDTVEVLASVDHTSSRGNGGANSLLGVNPAALIIGLAAGPAGGFLDPTQDIVGSTTRSSSITRAFRDSDNTGASLTVDWKMTDTVSLKSVTTYREFDIHAQFDFDSAAAILLENINTNRDAEMYSQEFQVAGSTEQTDWLVGAFFYDEEANDRRNQATLGVQGSPGGTIRINNPHEIQSTALFGQGTFRVSDRFAITAGLRWTEDEKEVIASELLANGEPVMFLPTDVNGNSGPLVIRGSDDWSALSGRVSFEFAPRDDIFLFASYARGFRAGALNDRPRANFDIATQADPSVNYGISAVSPEEMDVFELGFRSDLLDNRMRLNITAFYQDLKDFQIARQIDVGGTGTITLLENAAGSEAYGLEAEFQYVPTDNFSIDANIGLLRTEISEVDPGVALRVGDDLGNAPELTYNLGFDYSIDLERGARLGFRVDYAWVDDFYSNPGTDLQFPLDSYGLLDANILYTPASDRWDLAIYGKNLTDEQYFTQALNFQTIVLGYAQGTPGRDREAGVKINFHF